MSRLLKEILSMRLDIVRTRKKLLNDDQIELTAYDQAADYDFCDKHEKAAIKKILMEALYWARDVK